MKPATIVGIVLIALWIVTFAYGGFSYTKREKVLDLGPIEATAEKEHIILLLPMLVGICLVGGMLLVVVGNRQKWAK